MAEHVDELREFLSIQAQDFIEELGKTNVDACSIRFLSIQAQDFIEDKYSACAPLVRCNS